MNQKDRLAKSDSRRFDKQIEELKRPRKGMTAEDWKVLDSIPNYTGEEETFPFPYGGGRGKDFGKWAK